MTTVRLVPAASLGLDVVQQAAGRRSWTLRTAYLADDDYPFAQVWQAPDGTVVNWIVDDRIGVSYFEARGEDAGVTVDAIRAEFTILDRDQLFARWDGAADYSDRANAIRLIGAGAPEAFDRAWYGYFRRAFADEVAIVRFWAVLVSPIPSWPELRAHVDRLAREDPDETVRQRAALVSRAWQSV